MRECLDSVAGAKDDLNIEHFVVDNASNDDTIQVAENRDGVIVIRNIVKAGFASNNNIALKQTRGRYVLLLNPDTVVDRDSLSGMVRYMDDNPEIGVSSCKLVNPDGSIQYNARMFPTPLAVILRWAGYDRLFPRSKRLTRYLMSNWDHDSERDVDWIMGAFMMVRREVIDEIGLLDESFDPLYYEDIDWCRRIKKAGWRIRYVPYVRVVHKYDRESARSFFNRMTYVHLKNILRYFWKHRSSGR
ncbi:glycosyltransferase family 2 protein [bacterium]|nr:glycosyltransferase family 2 protein [candidate division CSSED10-310 bacterium]